MKPGFFTISEAANILKVHPNTLRIWEYQKKLIPQRDKATNYRYYSHQQITNFLLRGSTAKIKILWGYKQSVKAREKELEKTKKTLDVIVSKSVSTPDNCDIDIRLQKLLKEAVERGVKMRFIRDLDNPLMKSRAEKLKHLNISTKSKKIFDVTLSIRDQKIFRLEIPSDNPKQRLNLIINDSKIAKSFSIFFDQLWNN